MATTDNFPMNTSNGEINLGDSRLDTGINNNEIENIVMLQQSQQNTSVNFQRNYLNHNNIT